MFSAYCWLYTCGTQGTKPGSLGAICGVGESNPTHVGCMQGQVSSLRAGFSLRPCGLFSSCSGSYLAVIPRIICSVPLQGSHTVESPRWEAILGVRHETSGFLCFFFVWHGRTVLSPGCQAEMRNSLLQILVHPLA